MRTVLCLLLLGIACTLAADEPVRYEVGFDHAVHHELEIGVTWTKVPDGTLQVRMSRSSPGRYGLHEFVKNVYGVRAVDGKGRELEIRRSGPHGWDIPHHDGTVKLRYILFGNQADGTFSQIDGEHAHLNMPATFLWARGFDERPVLVRFQLPKDSGWSIATQLVETEAESGVYRAPDFQYFMDSPALIGSLQNESWTVASGGRTQTIRIALDHTGTTEELAMYAKMARAVVHEQIAIFGELPPFDHEIYTFLVDYHPRVSGDGMEHRNSTMITGTRPLKTHTIRNLGTLSHEFFHAWNVERLRPRALEPFRFEEVNICEELWFAEGFTSYYTKLAICRAGLITTDRYYESLESTLNQVIQAPARHYHSPVEMSLQSSLVDGVGSSCPTNMRNTYISYYTYGSAIALGLDLTLRSEFAVSLDDYMRAMWKRFGVTETGYDMKDLEVVLGETCGDPSLAKEFFARFVRGRDVVDYTNLFEHAGIVFDDEDDGKASLEPVSLEVKDSGAEIESRPPNASALYEAGLAKGDVITSLAGKKISKPSGLDSILEDLKIGEEVDIVYVRLGESKKSRIVIESHPSYRLRTYEQVERPVTEEIKQFRKSWLGSRSPVKHDLPEKVCQKCRRAYAFKLDYCGVDGEDLVPRFEEK